MVIQKTAVYKVLAIVLALSLFLGCSERVAAADDVISGSVEYNNLNIIYSYTSSFKTYANGSVVRNYTTDIPVFVCVALYEKNYDVILLSKESFYITGLSMSPYSSTLPDGSSYYYYTEVGNARYSMSASVPYNTTESVNASRNITAQFHNYFYYENIDDLIFEPDFYNCIGNDPILQLDNFQADIVEDDLIMVWEQPKIMPFRMMKNIFIQFRYSHRDPEAYTVGRVKYIDLSQYAAVSDGSITIPLSEIDTLPENHQISSIVATPYYYYADDIDSGEMIRGQATQVYFDIDGLSSAPILVNPDIKEEIPEENVEQNIFQSINNFFSGFFSNLISSIKTAVVPSGDDVLALLQEMNDWFSERFGFIWYPFDLAIDIVGAFALGEANSKFTVPALTLNMLGGIKLWDSFEVDLDPIGFMEYVRFFTSAIMCCGTVSLAIRKWDEWIGGEH